MNCAAHQEKEKNKNTSKRIAGEKRRQTIDFKELRAALLWSFREQHGKKLVCVEEYPG